LGINVNVINLREFCAFAGMTAPTELHHQSLSLWHWYQCYHFKLKFKDVMREKKPLSGPSYSEVTGKSNRKDISAYRLQTRTS
jgi:hypothetical protein